MPSPPLRVVVAGATGLIGTALVRALRDRGARVQRLTRHRAATEDVAWDPIAGSIDAAALDGVDVVVNLAGEPVGERWSDDRKRRIRDSRVLGTALLARTMASLAQRPRALVSGSAVGYYGDRGDAPLDESSAPGSDFLAGVCVEWERATAPASDAGIRVVHLRTGTVLAASGGALAKMLTPFRLGLGGKLGSGRQWMSWISLDDEVRAIVHAIDRDDVRGPLNLVAPNPVTNEAFVHALGHVLGRPTIIPVPAAALELAFGEMARATILASQRALPKALLAAGFTFTHPTIDAALRAAVG